MSSPLVSIIMPCFNGEHFVREAIQSALDQTYPSKEVIAIDDGSTDGSLSVIKEFESKIRWESGPNHGGEAARNRGLSMADGDFIQFHDADDLLDQKKLETQIPVLVESGADLVYSDWRLFKINRPETTTVYRVVPRSKDPVIIALQRQSISTIAPVIKKKALSHVKGFREDLTCSQERDLFLRLACPGARFSYLPETLHTLRQRSDSVSFDEVPVRLVLYDLLVNIYGKLEKENDLNDERKQAFATLIASGARRLFRFGYMQIAKEHFNTAYKMHPGGGLSGAYSRLGCLLAKTVGPTRAEGILMPLKKALAPLTG